MEIEIRARIKDPTEFVRRLGSLSEIRIVKREERQTDTYIKHGMDHERVLIIRIRRRADGAILTFKTKSAGNDTTWQDTDIPLPDPDRLEDILMQSGYVYVVLIDKVRDAFAYKDFEINVDQVRELGHFVEIAFETSEQVPAERENEIVAAMKRLLRDLGCDVSSIVEKGYVSLMEAEMKKPNADGSVG